MSSSRLYIIFFVLVSFFSLRPAAITYQFSGGRFGDNLIAYCHARWISYKYGISLFYRPFKYSDQLELHIQHPFFNGDDMQEFKTVVNFSHLSGKHNTYPFCNDSNLLYLLPYFPHCKSDIEDRFHFDIDWNDPQFKALLRKEIAPLEPVQLIELPKDRLHVAVHIRTGAGYDKVVQRRVLPDSCSTMSCTTDACKRLLEGDHESSQDILDTKQPQQISNVKILSRSMFADKLHPLKFPPNSFYVEQLKRLSELVQDQPLYVHIFTDSTQPESFVRLFEEEVGKSNIVYGCRSQGNHQDANVLDDFFALMQFDYLIRGESNFTIMTGKITDYKIVIYPAAYTWHRNNLMITAATTEIRQENGEVQTTQSNVHGLQDQENGLDKRSTYGLCAMAGIGAWWFLTR